MSAPVPRAIVAYSSRSPRGTGGGPSPAENAFQDRVFDVIGYSSLMRVPVGSNACRQASRTAVSASTAEMLRRVWPARCDCQSASDAARLNRCGAGGLSVGPYRRNSSAAVASIAPSRLSAQRSQRSRGASRSAHLAVFDAANAGRPGILAESNAAHGSLRAAPAVGMGSARHANGDAAVARRGAGSRPTPSAPAPRRRTSPDPWP